MNFAQPIQPIQPVVAQPVAAPATYGAAVPIDGQLTSVAFSANHTVTGSNASGAVYRRIGLAGAWQQVPAPAGVVRVSASDDGSLWCTTVSEQICRSVGGAWSQVAGAAKTVAVGNASNVYVANAGGQIWKFDGMASWQPVAAPFLAADVSVGADGTLYAVDQADGIHRFEPMLGQWTTIPGQLVQISVHNAQTVVGVNRAGQVYALNPATNTWTHLAHVPPASRVSASGEGLYVVGADQSVKFVPAVAAVMPSIGAAIGGLFGSMLGAMGAATQAVVHQPQPVVVQAGAPPTVFTPPAVFTPVFAQPVAGPCKKCHGKGGLGTFGPCEPGHMHFKAVCAVCQGSRVSILQHACQLCHGKGGIDTWGKPCESTPAHMHYKHACPACSGMGFTANHQSKCTHCHGHGAFDTWGKPCMAGGMHFKHACSHCNGRAFV